MERVELLTKFRERYKPYFSECCTYTPGIAVPLSGDMEGVGSVDVAVETSSVTSLAAGETIHNGTV